MELGPELIFRGARMMYFTPIFLCDSIGRIVRI
jgi:hypothetical protein